MKNKSNNIMAVYKLIVTVLLLHTCDATDPVYSPQNLSDTSGNFAFSNGTVIWAGLPSGEAYASVSVGRISEGLKAYYDMVHGFISVVLPKGIPDEIVEKLLDGKTAEIASNYSNYTSFFIGYAICATLGILFMLVVPILACCFCCCRCCCKKCGGKMTQSEEDAENTCKKWTFIFILLIIIAFLIAGGVCIILNNDATSTAINDIPKSTVLNLNNLEVYVNNTILEATHLIQNNYNFLNASLNRDLDNIAYLVGLPLRTDIETMTGIRTTLTNAYSLVTSLDNADTALTDIETKETNLRSSITAMEASLNTVKTSLDTIFTSCGVNCPNAGRPDYATAMATGFDSNNFPDLSGPRTSMNSTKGTNMTAQLVDAEAELDSIPDTVVNDSRTTVDDMKEKISNLSNDIDPIMDQINDINQLFIGSNASIDLDKLSDDVTDFGETLEKYDKYRWYGGLSLGCIVALFFSLMVVGLILGITGTNTKTHPANRGCLSNCGGILLMFSVYLIFIFSVFLMLLTTFPFLLGAPIHKLACVPITDLDELEKLAQIYNDHDVGAGKYFLGDLVLSNDTIALTLPGMLRDCRSGNSAFSSFKMADKFDLTDMLNYSKTLDVQSEIDSVNVDLSSVNVYPTALQTQLSDLETAININFTKFYVELSNSPTTGNLSDLADAIDTYAGTLGAFPATKTSLETEATNIRNIEANEYADVTSKISALNSSVASMETTVNGIPSQVTALDMGLNTTNTYIQTTTGTVVRNLLNAYASRMLGIADSFTAHTDDGIKNKMGGCAPVWNMYNSLLVYTFCYNLMDTFNGFWFSLGWCVFFSMLGLIFSVKLAKYFRCMRDMESTERESITPSKMFDNKVYPEVNPLETKGDLWTNRSNKVQVVDSECLHEHAYDIPNDSIVEKSMPVGTQNSNKRVIADSNEPAIIVQRSAPQVISGTPGETNELVLNDSLQVAPAVNTDKTINGTLVNDALESTVIDAFVTVAPGETNELESEDDNINQSNDHRCDLAINCHWALGNTASSVSNRGDINEHTGIVKSETISKTSTPQIIHVAPVEACDTDDPGVGEMELNAVSDINVDANLSETQETTRMNDSLQVAPAVNTDETTNGTHVDDDVDSTVIDAFITEILHKITEENAFVENTKT